MIEQIVEFVTVLHQQGFNLGVPIERFLFINVFETNQAANVLQDKGIPDDEVVKQSI